MHPTPTQPQPMNLFHLERPSINFNNNLWNLQHQNLFSLNNIKEEVNPMKNSINANGFQQENFQNKYEYSPAFPGNIYNQNPLIRHESQYMMNNNYGHLNYLNNLQNNYLNPNPTPYSGMNFFHYQQPNNNYNNNYWNSQQRNQFYQPFHQAFMQTTPMQRNFQINSSNPSFFNGPPQNPPNFRTFPFNNLNDM